MVRFLLLRLPILLLLLGVAACGGGYVEEARAAFSNAQWRLAISHYGVVGEDDLEDEDRIWLALAETRVGEVSTGIERLEGVARGDTAVARRALLALANVLKKEASRGDERQALEARLQPMKNDALAAEALAMLRHGAFLDAQDALQAALTKLAGPQGGERAGRLMRPLVTRSPAEREKAWEDLKPRLEERLGPHDETALKTQFEAMVAAHRAWSKAARHTLALAPTAFGVLYRQTEVTYWLAQTKALREAGEALLALDESAAKDLEARRLFPIQRRGALRLMMLNALETDRADEGLALADRHLPSFGSITQEALANLHGELLMKAGRFDVLLDHAKARVESDPEDVRATFHYGVALQAAGKSSEAIPYLRRAAAGRAQRGEELLWLGRAEREAGALQAARTTLARARDLSPWDPETWLALARTEVAAGREDLAIASLVRAQREQFPHFRDPRRQALNPVLLELWERRDGARAFTTEEAREILRTEPQNPYAHIVLADDELHGGLIQEARQRMRRLEIGYPEFGPVLLASARVVLAGGDAGAARERIDGLETAPAGEVSELERLRLGVRARLAEKDPRAALVASREGVKQWPGDVALAALHLEVLALTKEVAEGEAFLTDLDTEVLASPEVLEAAAALHLVARKPVLAVEAFHAADLARPLPGDLLLKAARLALQHGEAPERLHFAERLAERVRAGHRELAVLAARSFVGAKDPDTGLALLDEVAGRLSTGPERLALRSLAARLAHRLKRPLEVMRRVRDLRVLDDREAARRLMVEFALEAEAGRTALAMVARIDDPELKAEVQRRIGDTAPAVVLLGETDRVALDIAVRASDLTTATRIVEKVARTHPYAAGPLEAMRPLLDHVNALELRGRVDAALGALEVLIDGEGAKQ